MAEKKICPSYQNCRTISQWLQQEEFDAVEGYIDRVCKDWCKKVLVGDTVNARVAVGRKGREVDLWTLHSGSASPGRRWSATDLQV